MNYWSKLKKPLSLFRDAIEYLKLTSFYKRLDFEDEFFDISQEIEMWIPYLYLINIRQEIFSTLQGTSLLQVFKSTELL